MRVRPAPFAIDAEVSGLFCRTDGSSESSNLPVREFEVAERAVQAALDAGAVVRRRPGDAPPVTSR